MKKINLAISGCLGRMGQQLIKSSKSNKNFKLVTLTENTPINKKIAGIKLNSNTDRTFKKIDVIGSGGNINRIFKIIDYRMASRTKVYF